MNCEHDGCPLALAAFRDGFLAGATAMQNEAMRLCNHRAEHAPMLHTQDGRAASRGCAVVIRFIDPTTLTPTNPSPTAGEEK